MSSATSSAFASADSVSIDVLPSLLTVPAVLVAKAGRKPVTLSVVQEEAGPTIVWGGSASSGTATPLAKQSSKASLFSLTRPPASDPCSIQARYVFAMSLSNASELILHYLDTGGIPPTKAKAPVIRTITFDLETGSTRDSAVLALKSLRIPCKDYDVSKGIPPRKPIFMFVNPFGGVKEAVKIFDSVILPMLETAGIPYERKDTEFMGQAEKIMQTIDVTKYSAFISVSGDGVLHEVINGMMSRRDWRAARLVPVGTIGAGSSNAMNANLGHHFPAYGVLSIIKETTRPMDLISCTFHKSKKVVYSHLNMAWAYIADLDIESDQFRWIGREKTTLSALNRLIRLRKYRAHVGILPVSEAPQYENDHHESTKLDPEAPAAAPPAAAEAAGSSEDSAAAASAAAAAEAEIFSYGPKRHLSNLAVTDPIYSKQLTPLRDPISYFTATNLPWISTTFKAANRVDFASGCVEVTFGGKHLSRWGMITALLNESVPEDLRAVGVESMQVKGFRLEPLGWGWGLEDWVEGREQSHIDKLVKNVGGVVAISGEAFGMEPLTVEVHDSIVNIISGSWME
ncbi:ATP-NAD kinase-like domain-containing protein [Obelidium mucronatum]|nr:ATP-NAD kinase-like domain-containing protein [Obelidium mucronatum]